MLKNWLSANNSTTISLLFFAIPMLTSFSRNKITVEKLWVAHGYNSDNQTFIYHSDTKFREARCLHLLAGGKARIKQNVSGCGTTFPGQKTAYEIVDATWALESDSLLILNYIQFGDPQVQRLKIISLTEKELAVK